jgi:hypothetical protein
MESSGQLHALAALLTVDEHPEGTGYEALWDSVPVSHGAENINPCLESNHSRESSGPVAVITELSSFNAWYNHSH